VAKLGMAFIIVLSFVSLCRGQTTVSSSQKTALVLEQQGQYAEAEAVWYTWIKTHPVSAEAYAHLGFLEACQKRYKEAVQFYLRALTINPSMPGLQLNLGLALFKSGALKESIAVFTELLKNIPPSDPEVQRVTALLGIAYYGLGNSQAAIPYLKEAAAHDSQNLTFRLLLAHSCMSSKQFQCVLDVYREILTLNAESAEADILAGEALDEMKNRYGAIQQFRAAVKADSREPNVHFGLGYLLWTQTQFREAANEFQAELINVPDNAQAMAYLADCDMRLEQPETALSLIQKAIRINAGIEIAHLDLGILYVEAGRREDALVELKQAVQLNPNDVNAHLKLARLYQTMGEKNEAKDEFNKVRNLNEISHRELVDKFSDAETKGKLVKETADALVNNK
jgi:tetratricopeptide (TPR) repeat protein